jgi:hypothetical protein
MLGQGVGVFHCVLDAVKPLLSLLHALSVKSKAHCRISEEGIHLLVGDFNYQINAYFRAEFTQKFTLNADELAFLININAMKQCLSIFGNLESEDEILDSSANCEFFISDEAGTFDIMLNIINQEFKKMVSVLPASWQLLSFTTFATLKRCLCCNR